MNILAIETATEVCSVAFARYDNDTDRVTLVHQQDELTPRSHTQRLLPMIDEMLCAVDLPLAAIDLIACSRGPGAFTGLRIGIAAAQGLAMALGCPVVPVSTLAALAQAAIDKGAGARGEILLPVIDARMDEVYWGCYRADHHRATALQPDVLTAPAAVAYSAPVILVGNPGVPVEDLTLSISTCFADITPTAAAVARVATADLDRAIPPGQLQALYLRNEVAWQGR